MPIDYEAEDTIVLGKDLKPGICVRSTSWSEKQDGNDMGVIVSTTMTNERLKKFYGDEPAYEIYDINCPCDGPCSSKLDLEKEFKMINSRKDILYTYKTIEHQILSRAADLIEYRNKLMKIKDVEFDRLGDKLDALKKELEKDYTCKHAHATINKIYCDTPDINSCPDGYAKLYTEENCPELKKINPEKD